MKYNLLELLVMALMTIVGTSSCEAKPSKDALPTEKMQKSLGDSITKVSMNAKNITVELQGASQTDSVVKNAKLTKKQCYVMRFMITNEKNFESNDTVYGKIMPNAIYTFSYKKQNVLVAIDFGLRKWQIQDESGKPLIQFDLKDEGLLYLTHLVFPENGMINYYYENKEKK